MPSKFKRNLFYTSIAQGYFNPVMSCPNTESVKDNNVTFQMVINNITSTATKCLLGLNLPKCWKAYERDRNAA